VTVKVTFEMDAEDFENLTSIIHSHIVKHQYDAPTNLTYTEAEIKWHVSHGKYVQKHILDKIIKGATHV
jgi:hypothetical protein